MDWLIANGSRRAEHKVLCVPRLGGVAGILVVVVVTAIVGRCRAALVGTLVDTALALGTGLR